MAILCNTVEQARAYLKGEAAGRYAFAVEMAETWFAQLQKMDPNEREKFQKEIAG